MPRQWYIFAGRLTKNFEYFTSWAEGIDTLNMLWTFLNIRYDDRLQFKIGRVFVPFAYEWYRVPTPFLINPERSLWTNNFVPATDVGMFAWGQLFENRFDYAVGIFNGTKNSFVDSNNSKDVIAFPEFHPLPQVRHPRAAELELRRVGGRRQPAQRPGPRDPRRPVPHERPDRREHRAWGRSS